MLLRALSALMTTAIPVCSCSPLPQELRRRTLRIATSTTCCWTESLRAAAITLWKRTGCASFSVRWASPSTTITGDGMRKMGAGDVAPTPRTTGGSREPPSLPRAGTASRPVSPRPRPLATGPRLAAHGTCFGSARSRAALPTSRRPTASESNSRSSASTWTTSAGPGVLPMGAPARDPTTGTNTGGANGVSLVAASSQRHGRT